MDIVDTQVHFSQIEPLNAGLAAMAAVGVQSLVARILIAQKLRVTAGTLLKSFWAPAFMNLNLPLSP